MTIYPGEGEEKAYAVAVFVDGLPVWAELVDARSPAEACVIAYALAVLRIMRGPSATGTPAPPPAAATSVAVQLEADFTER